ncbi:MAG TPA: hypothetical protein VF746_24970 [Longimicrobium sp.]|jgi:hypothetical protein
MHRSACRLLLLLVPLLAAAPLQGQRSEVVHRTPGDTLRNSYRVYHPAGAPRALLVLLPGWGSGVDSFSAGGFTPSTLPARMAERGVLTIVALPAAETLYAGDEPLRILDDIVAEVLQRHRIPRDRVAIGGFSAGGTGAVRYAQLCARGGCRATPRPAAVFAVDSPLDFERMYRSEELSVRRAAPRTNVDESRLVVAELGRALGGSPDEAPAAYRRSSPVLASAPDGGNAGLLAATPLRLYTEPDVLWWIENRNLDYHAMNALDLAALVNVLRIRGNPRAELVTTTAKGYRPGGARHPHSWSIVDEADLAAWLFAWLIPAA